MFVLEVNPDKMKYEDNDFVIYLQKPITKYGKTYVQIMEIKMRYMYYLSLKDQAKKKKKKTKYYNDQKLKSNKMKVTLFIF